MGVGKEVEGATTAAMCLWELLSDGAPLKAQGSQGLPRYEVGVQSPGGTKALNLARAGLELKLGCRLGQVFSGELQCANGLMLLQVVQCGCVPRYFTYVHI